METFTLRTAHTQKSQTSDDDLLPRNAPSQSFFPWTTIMLGSHGPKLLVQGP